MADLHMQIAGTQQGIDGVRKATDLIQDNWQRGQAAIRSAEGELGRGPLGNAFMSVHRPEVELAAKQVRALVDGGRALVDAGQRSVEEYQQTDQRLRAEFEKLLSPSLLMTWRR